MTVEVVWSVVVAGGAGRRYGTTKQFEVLRGRRVLDWSLDACRKASVGVVAVVPPGSDPEPGADLTVPGGATRSASVRAGLEAVPTDATIVIIHDGARPLAAPRLFDDVLAAIDEGADAAFPGVDVTDTLRRRSGGVVDRDELVAVQTPQAFRAAALRAAHAGEPEATDDVAVVEAAGASVAIVPGDRRNLKITEPADLDVASLLITTAAQRARS